MDRAALAANDLVRDAVERCPERACEGHTAWVIVPPI
jgi:hypothetical protein